MHSQRMVFGHMTGLDMYKVLDLAKRKEIVNASGRSLLVPAAATAAEHSSEAAGDNSRHTQAGPS